MYDSLSKLELGIPSVRDSLFAGALMIALAYNTMQQQQTNTLLSMIVISGVIWVMYTRIAAQSAAIDSGQDKTIDRLNAEARRYVGTMSASHMDTVWGNTLFPKKGFMYLAKNPDLVEIAKDLVILRMFDRGRYADMCQLLNTYQKIYEYVLSDRYDAAQYMQTFADVGDAVLENIYSGVFILPLSYKHTYGVDSDALVQTNVRKFMVLRERMTAILKSYAEKELGIPPTV